MVGCWLAGRLDGWLAGCLGARVETRRFSGYIRAAREAVCTCIYTYVYIHAHAAATNDRRLAAVNGAPARTSPVIILIFERHTARRPPRAAPPAFAATVPPLTPLRSCFTAPARATLYHRRGFLHGSRRGGRDATRGYRARDH